MTKRTWCVVIASSSLFCFGTAWAEGINGRVDYTRSTVNLGEQNWGIPGISANGEIETNRVSGYASYQLKQQRLNFDASLVVMQGDVDPGGTGANTLDLSGNSIGVGMFVLDSQLYSLGLRLTKEKMTLDRPTAEQLDIESDVVSFNGSLFQDDINIHVGASFINSDNVTSTNNEYLAEDTDNAAVGVQYFLKSDAALVLEKGLADTQDFFAFGFEYKFSTKPYGLLLSSLQGDNLETINLSLIYHFQGNRDLKANTRSGLAWRSLVLDRR